MSILITEDDIDLWHHMMRATDQISFDIFQRDLLKFTKAFIILH